MFEAQIVYYLNEYLGTYVQGIDRDSLKVSIYAGDVVLRNLRLKQDALEDLDLPVSVEAGMLGSLTLKVPWNNLGGTPVVAEVNQLYLLVRPRSGDKGHGVSEDSWDMFDEMYEKSRMSRVERKEKAWVKGLERMKVHEDGRGQQKGFLKGLIDTVIGNLQISIKNIHIRYEDGITRPGHVFSCGFTLKQLSAFTVDGQGNKAFIASKVMDALRKSLELERMSIYFDCDTTMWSPVETWDGMDTDTWREWFQPDIEKDNLGRRYVLCPVDGRASYTRRWKDIDQEKDAATELSVHLDTVSVSVSRDQYCNYSLLLTEISQYTTRLPYSGFRPQCRPEVGMKARCWWMYLLYVHKQNAETRKFKWDQVIQSVKLRSKYISLYKVMLKMADFKSRKDVLVPDDVEALYQRDKKIIHGMEKELSEVTLLMFRRVARSEYAEEQKKIAAEQAKTQQRGWMGWLMGAPAQNNNSNQSSDGAANLSSTEYETILEVLKEQEETMSLKFETPYTLLSKYVVHVSSVSLILVGESPDDRVLEGSMQNIVTEVVSYPQTMSLRVNVGGMGVDSPKGPFVKTGRSIENKEESESEALAVYFISKPQDGRADAIVNAELAPSFVYYDPKVVGNVVDFFQPPEEFAVQDLGELSLAAASQVERAKQIAAEYAVAAWSGKPSLEMSLVLNAPKISIPAKGSRKQLALDLGSFIIQSDNDIKKTLPEKERALYECIKIKGSNLSAFMAGDVVDWGRQESFSSRASLLDQCALDMSLHIARYADAEYPMIRILSSIPTLQFAIGPSLVGQLMQVLGNIAPERENPDTLQEHSDIIDHSWLESAEWRRKCKILQWASFQSNAFWKEFDVVLYHSTLYCIEESSHGAISRQYTLRNNSVVSKIPEDILSIKFAVAIHDSPDNDWKAILRDAGSWVMEFDDQEDLDTFVEEINSNLHRIRALASELDVGKSTEDEEEIQARSIVYVRAELEELKVILAGRGPLYYGEYDQNEEVDIISVKASKGLFDFHYGPDEMQSNISLMALEIEDMICGPSLEEKCLATSCIDGTSADAKNLADFRLTKLSPANPSYDGIQTRLSANLDSLYFFCNRPTIGCLMAFGSEVAMAVSSEGSSVDMPVEQSLEDVEGVVAESVLVFCQDPDTTSFLLDVRLQRLQLVLNYEDSNTKLAEADISDFTLKFETVSDGRMKIGSSLGNLNLVRFSIDASIQSISNISFYYAQNDLTLGLNSTNSHICGLRDNKESSLISINFEMYPAHVDSGLNCPDGLSVSYLEAHLSKLRILFLYRFIQQCIQYIVYMLQFRPEELVLENSRGNVPSLPDERAVTSEQPFALVMKLSMDAPLIIMPRSSISSSGVKADLGTLTLENSIKRAETGELLDESILNLSGVTLMPCSGEGEGASLIQLSDEGWTIQWQRPLGEVDDKCIPDFALDITIPTLQGHLSDLEYQSVTTIASSNISEEIDLPPGVESIHRHMNEIGPVSSLTSDLVEHALVSPRKSHDGRKPEGIKFRLHLWIKHLQLDICNEIGAGKRNDLGQLQINDLDVLYTSFACDDTLVELSLPKLEVSDRRSHVSLEQSLVISSGHRASFLMLRYLADEREKDLKIILQKPMVILELGFLLELARFFVPSFSFVKSDPLPFFTHDLVLKEGSMNLPNDIWLSPAVRILADTQPAEYIMDGQGHSIFLPPVKDLSEVSPLIMVGPNSILKMRNVKIYNSESLNTCLKLGPGAKILLSREDGVELFDTAQEGRDDSEIDLEKGYRTEDIPSQKYNLTISASNVGVYLLKAGEPISQQKSCSNEVSSATAHTIKIQADISAQMNFDEHQMHVKSSIDGLRASHNRISNLKEQAVSRSNLELARHTKLKAKKESDILLPTGIKFDFKSGDKDVDMTLSISEVHYYISPGLLELGTKLCKEALAPLQQPGPDAAAFAVSKFQKLCTVKCNGSERVYNEALLFESEMVTFWKPSAPTGYAFGGHVITQGEKAPSFEVMCLAMNSGLVKRPDKFELLFSNDIIWLWGPATTEGFAAVGVFVTMDPNPPSIEGTCCVACDALVKAPLGERIRLCSCKSEAVISNIDNSFGTFLQSQSSQIFPVDLRFPVGVTTYGLFSRNLSSTLEPGRSIPDLLEQSRKIQDQYIVSQRKQNLSQSRSVISPQTMDFKRIWTDNGSLSASRGVSIWRPIPPPGYVILGDAFQNGFEPPKFVHVLRMEESSLIAKETKRCVRPLKLQMIWHDGNPKHEHGLSIWKPVPPEGYTAAGHIAQIGMKKPDVDVVCVLNELVHIAPSPRKPLWSVKAADQSVNPLSVWHADERTGCFCVDPTDHLTPPEIWVLNMSALEPSASDDSGKTINAVVRVKSIQTTFLNTIGSPLLKFNVSSIESGIRGYSQEVIQSYGGFQPSLHTYNCSSGLWEPVIEPFDAIIKVDSNFTNQNSSGIDPGVHVSVKSSTEMIMSTLAVKQMHSFVSAIEEATIALQEDVVNDAILSNLFSNGNGIVKSRMRNKLGVPVNLEVEELSGIKSYCIDVESDLSIERPVPQKLVRVDNPTDKTNLPPALLLVDIHSVDCPIKNTRLYISVELNGRDDSSCLSPKTRSAFIDGGEIVFDERLVLSLSQQNETVSECLFEVWDAFSNYGRGSVFAKGYLKLRDIQPNGGHHTISLSNNDGAVGSLTCKVQIQTHGISNRRDDAATDFQDAGKMAINIPSAKDSKDIWRIIPDFSESFEQNPAESKSSASVTSIQFGNDLIVIESAARQGSWSEIIRSNCKFRNQTGLQVSLELVFEKSQDTKSLGIVQPGKSLPLPLYWDRPDVLLSVVPASDSSYSCIVNQQGTSAGISLFEIQDGWTTFMECRPIDQKGDSTYFSAYAYSKSLPRSQRNDWEVVLNPPLVLRNHVPVPLHVQVEQGIGAGRPPSFSGLVETGANIPIYNADIMDQISLKFESEEYIWLEKGPVPVAGAKCSSIRDSARLSRPGQEIPTEIFIGRTSVFGNRSSSGDSSIVLTLFSPLWILNKTSWEIRLALLPTLNLAKKPRTDSNLAQKFGETSTFGSFVAASDEIDTDQVSNARAVSPGSVELLSFPAASLQESSAESPYAIRMKVQGSGWTEPILFDEEFAKKHGFAAVSSRPMLLFSDSRAHSTAYGSVVRLEMSEFKESRILHIDTHMLIQNRSSVDFEGFQCRLKDQSASVMAQKSGVIVPEGGELKQTPGSSVSSNAIQTDNPIAGKSFVKMSDESFDEIMHSKALFDLPADCMCRPVNFIRGLYFHAVCLRQKSPDTAENIGIWSRPVVFDDSGEGTKFVLVPVLQNNMLEGHKMIRLRFTIRGPGLTMITIETADCYPPYVLENRTDLHLQYVQPGCNDAPIYDLPGYTAVGFVPDFSTPGEKVRVELFSESFKSYSKIVELDEDNDGEVEELSVSSTKSCLIKTSYENASVLTPLGDRAMSGDSTGYSIGRGSVEKVVRIASAKIELLRMPQKSSVALNEIFFSLDIPGLSVSIIDAYPREISLITVLGIHLKFDRLLMPNGIGSQIGFVANSLQADNQMPGTLLPVALCRALASKSSMPFIECRYCTFSSRTRAGVLLPFIGCRMPNKIQLAIEESLIWRLYGVYESIVSLLPSHEESEKTTTAAADAFVRLRLLSVSRTDLSVSFQNNPQSRPLSIHDSSLGMILDLAAFKGANLSLKGFELQQLNLSQSSLTQRIIERIRSDLIGAAFSLISTFGLVGGASRLIGFLGAKVAKFADSGSGRKHNLSAPSETTQPKQAIESNDSLKTSMIKGFKGLVSKPVEGAKKDGFEGAFKGMAKGVVGVFANPMSTMLATSSEGYNSNFAKDRASVLVLERKRLPRVISTSGRITPMTRRGTDRESVLEALGQSFLWATWIADPLVDNMPLESYEEHFVLPNGYVLLFTSSSILHIHSPYFAELDGAAEIGTLPAIEIPPGNIKWRIIWEDLLAMELRWSDPTLQPDKLVMHRKGNLQSEHSRQQPQELSRDIMCFPKTPQASQIKFIASKLLSKYYQDPQRQDHRWAMRHQARAALPQDKAVEDFPLQMPCTAFEKSWQTNPRRSPVVHFWNPVPPPGYKPVGSVATLGPEQPVAPVPCFRDDITLRGRQILATDRPHVAFPEEYSLIWRFNGERPVTMWMPVPPKGYKAMGAIILNSATTPSLDDYVCLREDLVSETSIFDSPIWTYDPDAIQAELQTSSHTTAKASLSKSFKSLKLGNNQQQSTQQAAPKHMSDKWKVSVWQVDNGRCMTLLVVRGLKKPPTKLSFTLTGVDFKT